LNKIFGRRRARGIRTKQTRNQQKTAHEACRTCGNQNCAGEEDEMIICLEKKLLNSKAREKKSKNKKTGNLQSFREEKTGLQETQLKKNHPS